MLYSLSSSNISFFALVFIPTILFSFWFIISFILRSASLHYSSMSYFSVFVILPFLSFCSSNSSVISILWFFSSSSEILMINANVSSLVFFSSLLSNFSNVAMTSLHIPFVNSSWISYSSVFLLSYIVLMFLMLSDMISCVALFFCAIFLFFLCFVILLMLSSFSISSIVES